MHSRIFRCEGMRSVMQLDWEEGILKTNVLSLQFLMLGKFQVFVWFNAGDHPIFRQWRCVSFGCLADMSEIVAVSIFKAECLLIVLIGAYSAHPLFICVM